MIFHNRRHFGRLRCQGDSGGDIASEKYFLSFFRSVEILLDFYHKKY